jgi:hypothetical protein
MWETSKLLKPHRVGSARSHLGPQRIGARRDILPADAKPELRRTVRAVSTRCRINWPVLHPPGHG